jgi:hypothetical protein
MTSFGATAALCLGLSISTWACADRPAPALQRESPAQAQAPQPPARQGPQPQRPQPEPPPLSEADGGRSALETCVDAQLSARGLNAFGDPAGTMYAGGTPLFDEAAAGGAGRARARVPWILKRHPEIAATCAGTPKVAAPDRPGDR